MGGNAECRLRFPLAGYKERLRPAQHSEPRHTRPIVTAALPADPLPPDAMPGCALPGTPLADALPGINACVHCGFCLQACPTYLNLEDENDSPRGRIFLMRSLLEGTVSPDDPS